MFHAEFMVLGLAAQQSMWLGEPYCDMKQLVIAYTLMCDNDTSVKIFTDNTANKHTWNSNHEFLNVNEQLNKKKL